MAWLHVEIRGRQCKSHRMINYMKYENCDTIDSTKKGLWLNPYAIYLDSIFSQRAKDYRKSPLLSAFKSKLSFIFLWIFDRKKNTQQTKKRTNTMSRLHIFAKYLANKEEAPTHKFQQNHWPIWEQSPNSSSANKILPATIFHSTKIISYSNILLLMLFLGGKNKEISQLWRYPLSNSARTR